MRFSNVERREEGDIESEVIELLDLVLVDNLRQSSFNPPYERLALEERVRMVLHHVAWHRAVDMDELQVNVLHLELHVVPIGGNVARSRYFPEELPLDISLDEVADITTVVLLPV